MIKWWRWWFHFDHFMKCSRGSGAIHLTMNSASRNFSYQICQWKILLHESTVRPCSFLSSWLFKRQAIPYKLNISSWHFIPHQLHNSIGLISVPSFSCLLSSTVLTHFPMWYQILEVSHPTTLCSGAAAYIEIQPQSLAPFRSISEVYAHRGHQPWMDGFLFYDSAQYPH